MGASNCTKAAKTSKSQTQQYTRNQFEFKKVIGKGGFGRVWKVTDKKSKKVYALKVMDKAKIITKRSVGSVLNQREILCKLQHNFIVNMHCAFQDRDSLYLLIDYLEGGDLRYYINRSYAFSEQQIKFVIRCIMQGLNYLHENNIIHRDIKPENIILDKQGYCRVTDLGVARYWKSQNSHETSGTPGYMAPEVLLRQNHSFCADYFAVGVIAYELALGKRPFQGRDRKSIRDQMLAREAKIPTNYRGLSNQGIDFINRMIQRYSKKRLGYNGIDQIINHPWLKMSNLQYQQFCEQNTKSPIKPLQISLHQSLNEVTEPDDVWRQNILLLKRPETQNLFADYNYIPSTKHKTEQNRNERLSLKSNANQESLFSSLKQDLYRNDISGRSTQSQIQDTISFVPSSRRKSMSTRL